MSRITCDGASVVHRLHFGILTVRKIILSLISNKTLQSPLVHQYSTRSATVFKQAILVAIFRFQARSLYSYSYIINMASHSYRIYFQTI